MAEKEKFTVSNLDFEGKKITLEMLIDEIPVGNIDLSICNDDTFDQIINDNYYIYLDQLHVDQFFRKQGIANKLMQKLDVVCGKYFRGYRHIVLSVNSFDGGELSEEVLKNFYRKFEFEEVAYTSKIMFKTF